jgi:type IV pilus assembly protein PilW
VDHLPHRQPELIVRPHLPSRLSPNARQRGLSLIELMIAITLGLLVLAGLTTVFVTASESQRELQRSAQQIENGRYAMDVLSNDVNLAGFYGRYSAYSDPAAIPDPCITGNEAALTTSLRTPIQAFLAADQSSIPSLAGTTCGTYLTAANLHPGSDILVIRRVETTTLRYPGDGFTPAVTAADTMTTNEVYTQTNPKDVSLFFGAGTAVSDATPATVLQRNGKAESVRKLRVHIYFVAPCSLPAGAACSSSDDGGTPVPTLKRLELTVSGGARTFNVVPISEGIQAFKVELGIDNSPNAVNACTTRKGDGAPDLYLPNSTTAAISVADLAGVVSAKVWIIARSPQATPGFTDTKTYAVATPSTVLGAGTVAGTGLTYGPYNDGYKRHAFFSELRAVNPSSRREIPPACT